MTQDYQDVRDKLETARKQGAFIFLPSPILNKEDSFYMPVVEIVRLRPDEVYKATGKYRKHYAGLLRLSLAAGFEWSAIDTCRTDNMTDKLYCSFRAVGGVRKADGRIYFHKAEKDIDLEIIEMELEDQYKALWPKIGKNEDWKRNGHKTIETYVPAMVRRDLIQKRKNKLTFVESGAKARVIRFVLGLQGQYSDKGQILGTDFVLVHYALNPNHPDVKQTIMQSLPGAQTMIYGGVKDTGHIALPQSQIIDVGQIPDNDEETVSIYDIKEIKDFEALDVKDQEKWLKNYAAELQYTWNDCIAGLKDVAVTEASQKWRTDFFIHIKKDLKGAQ